MTHTYNSLFFVTVAAVLGPWVSTHLMRSVIPSVVIEIVLGYLIGPHVLHIADQTPNIYFLSQFGFAYLMFVSGMELDFDLLLERPTKGQSPAWLRGLLFFAVTLLVSLAISLWLHYLGYIKDVLLVMLLLSTTSLGLVTPALKEHGWIRDRFGQEVLLYALIADVATLIVFTAYITFHSTGNAFSFLLVMVLLLFFVFVYRVLLAARHLPIFRVVENATSEIGIRAAFALVLAFLAFSQSLGTEVVIAAFLAGAIISLLAEKHSIITHKLNSIGYGFFIPIFFVSVGMGFNINAIAGTTSFITLIGILFVTMYLNKLVPSLWFLRKFGIRQRLAGGMLLSSRLSLMIAASQIGEQAGLISSAMSNGFVLLAIVTCVLSPAMFNQVIRGVPVPAADAGKLETPILTIDRDTLPPDWEIRQIEVLSRRLNDVPLRTLHLPQDLLFVSIVRDDERIVPRGHTKLEQFDVVQVMGTPENLQRLTELMEEIPK
jgi:Kef-type K+ transport system membrane component KefB